ncbi:hypothetical protein ACFFUR_12580, partial [Echinicola jeungdonensis]
QKEVGQLNFNPIIALGKWPNDSRNPWPSIRRKHWPSIAGIDNSKTNCSGVKIETIFCEG